ncbi:MAG: hypothetical protein WBV64_19295, partial [Mycobacterium sp.]
MSSGVSSSVRGTFVVDGASLGGVVRPLVRLGSGLGSSAAVVCAALLGAASGSAEGAAGVVVTWVLGGLVLVVVG